MEFVIDEELRALIPPLSQEEYEQLEQNILEHGCLAPLNIWPVPDSDEVILLDGHNRFKICSEHNVKYDTESISLIDRAAAIKWMISNQLGRRNLSPAQASYLRGKQYQQQKQDINSGHRGGDKMSPPGGPTAARIGKQHGLSYRTIQRDEEYASAVDAIVAATAPEVQQQLLSKLTKSATLKLAELAKNNPEAVIEVLEEVNKCKNKAAANAVVSKFTDAPNPKAPEVEDPCEVNDLTEALDLMTDKFTESQIKQAVSQYFESKRISE